MWGNQATHVANAYHRDIYVKCDHERSYVIDSSYSVGGASGSAKLDWHKVETGFNRIIPNDYQRFPINEEISASSMVNSLFGKSTKIVYISIFVNGLARNVDESIIVTRDGVVKDAEYGSIWKDKNGTYHKR